MKGSVNQRPTGHLLQEAFPAILHPTQKEFLAHFLNHASTTLYICQSPGRLGLHTTCVATEMAETGSPGSTWPPWGCSCSCIPYMPESNLANVLCQACALSPFSLLTTFLPSHFRKRLLRGPKRARGLPQLTQLLWREPNSLSVLGSSPSLFPLQNCL